MAFNPSTEDAVHVEVSASCPKPVGSWRDYLDSTPKDEKIQGVIDEADKKYYQPNMIDKRKKLCPGYDWRCVLAYTILNDEEEQLEVLRRCEVDAVSFAMILSDLAVKDRLPHKTGSDAAHFACVAGAYKDGLIQ